jgi:hypothetical protein
MSFTTWRYLFQRLIGPKNMNNKRLPGLIQRERFARSHPIRFDLVQ